MQVLIKESKDQNKWRAVTFMAWTAQQTEDVSS